MPVYTQLNVKVPLDVKNQLKINVIKTGLTREHIITHLLEYYLKHGIPTTNGKRKNKV